MPRNHFSEMVKIHGVDNNDEEDLNDNAFDDSNDGYITTIVRCQFYSSFRIRASS